MGCYDTFRFKEDFNFKNNKGDIVTIHKGEYQTKRIKSLLDILKINENNEIERPIYKSEQFKEYPVLDPRRWKTTIIGYKKINFSGCIRIYDYDYDDSTKDKMFNIWVDNGKIFKIENIGVKI